MKMISLAAGQFEVTKSIDKNLERISDLVREAAGERARIVLFPECALTGYPGADLEALSELDPDRVGEALETLGRLAREVGIYIATGAAILMEGPRHWKNSLVVYSDQGQRISAYSKHALTHSDQTHFDPGDTNPTFELDGLRFGCQICFDVRFAEGYRRLFAKGVHVVLHSYHQAGTRHWKQRRDIMRSFQRVRASENGVYAVASNTIGHNRGKDQWIQTMIVNPIGEIVKALPPSKTGVIVGRIDGEDVIEMIELDIRDTSARFLGVGAADPRPKPGVDIR